MNKKKISVVITARASYSRIKSALTGIQEHDNLELTLIVAASALSDRYGSASKVIENDGFTIHARVYNLLETGSLTGQAKTTGLGIIELSNIFENEKPDAVVTIADRYETMATAIAASYMNIPLIHIQGGEVTGNIDEKVRHAISKLADLHLVSTLEAKTRLIKMGENPDKIFVTGCPSIDLAVDTKKTGALNFNPYEKYGGVGSLPDYANGYLVVMQHPVTTEVELARKQIEETIRAIADLKIPTFWFWPNVDAGTDGTSKGIREHREKNNIPFIHFYRNMEPEDFLSLLMYSQCLVGNSSVGIRECSYLGVPTVNIGSRQSGRERGKNVIDVNYDHVVIEKAIKDQILHGHYQGDTIYGDGLAGQNIAQAIANAELCSSKKLTY